MTKPLRLNLKEGDRVVLNNQGLVALGSALIEKMQHDPKFQEYVRPKEYEAERAQMRYVSSCLLNGRYSLPEIEESIQYGIKYAKEAAEQGLRFASKAARERVFLENERNKGTSAKIVKISDEEIVLDTGQEYLNVSSRITGFSNPSNQGRFSIHHEDDVIELTLGICLKSAARGIRNLLIRE